jgi:hypothetical protein
MFTGSQKYKGIFNLQEEIEKKTGGYLHHMQVKSLASVTQACIKSASLAVTIIGNSLAQAHGITTKSAVKQVDRLISSENINPWNIMDDFIRHTVGDRKEIVVAMDWTEFDKDDQSTLALNIVEKTGKSQPLVWRSFWKHELKDQRNQMEYTCLKKLANALDSDVKVTILADRGFGDSKLFAFLTELGFDFVIRFRENITVYAENGVKQTAAQWVGKNGAARKLPNASVTAKQQPVGAVVCVHDKGMKDAWCLATSHKDKTSREIINLYAKRWSIEPGFRDTKDIRFGMGLAAIRVSDPERRDMLLLLNAFAMYFLILLGVASEATGMDRRLKSSTTKRRTHSLFRQGCMVYDLIPTMRHEWLEPIMICLEKLLKDYMNVEKMLIVISRGEP